LPQPQPEVAPLPATSLAASKSAGWFAQHDPRTGELEAATEEVPRQSLAARAAQRLYAGNWVERRLPNGAYEIELPPEVSTPLYGWVDGRGELHTGHEVPAGASQAPPAATLPTGGEP
jgi:hypothetical protein